MLPAHEVGQTGLPNLDSPTFETWTSFQASTSLDRGHEQVSELLVDAYAGALLVEHAGWEASNLGSDRGALVARLYARAHLADRDPLGRIDEPAEELERFKELWDGALVDDRSASV